MKIAFRIIKINQSVIHISGFKERCMIEFSTDQPLQNRWCYKLVAKTHRLACGMKATYFLLGFYIE